jgi:hypothetical protein
MRIPALSDAVIYTASDGAHYAATVAKVTPGSDAVGLTVHWYGDQVVHPLRDVPFSAERAKDSWAYAGDPSGESVMPFTRMDEPWSTMERIEGEGAP